MKKILLSLLIFAGLLSSKQMSAQSFTVEHDTVRASINNTATIYNNITNTSVSTGPGLTVKWKVKNTDFPADWLAATAFGICDNNACVNNTGDTALWNAAKSTGTTYTSLPYVYNVAGTFDLNLNFTMVTLGTHWVTITITDPTALPAYNKDVTFIVTKMPTSIPSMSSQEDKVMLYPNPANNDLNLVFDANADVKNIAVYNVIGKIMNVYKVTGNSANLNIENIPSGIYFVKLYNASGNVVVTRKFTKQ